MQKTPTNRRPIADLPPAQRSRVGNKKSLFISGDQRTAFARRFREIFESHVADLGGDAELSEAQRQLVRRLTTLELELERQESAMSRGEPINVDLYSTVVNTARRLTEELGLRKVSKDPSDDLGSFLAKLAAEKKAQ
jgi:hypothetical protein